MISGSKIGWYLCRIAAFSVLLGTAIGEVSAAVCLPDFDNGWIRLPPLGEMTMAAGFGQLHNKCAQPVTVVSASSPAFAEVSVHDTTQVDGVSRMREIKQLVLTPGQTITLAPGGLHLMLMGNKTHAALKDGARVPIVFTLQDGHALSAQLQVRKQAP